MRDWGISVLLTGLLASTTGVAQEASSMVVIIAGDRTFHQPGCALVAKAGSNVTVAKRGEAVRRGLTPHDCGPDASGAPTADPNAVKVVTQPRDNKYHRATCAKLGRDPLDPDPRRGRTQVLAVPGVQAADSTAQGAGKLKC